MPNCSLECTNFPSISIVWDGLVTTSSTTLCGMNLLNLCKSVKWEIISCFHLHLKLLVRWNILCILLASCVFCEWPIYILCLYSPIGLLSFPYCFIKDDFFFSFGKGASCYTSCRYYSLILSFDFIYGVFSFNFHIDTFMSLLCYDFCFVPWLEKPLLPQDHKNIYTHFLLAFLWLYFSNVLFSKIYFL